MATPLGRSSAPAAAAAAAVPAAAPGIESALAALRLVARLSTPPTYSAPTVAPGAPRRPRVAPMPVGNLNPNAARVLFQQ
jgi:hypothetical protein